MFPSGLYISAPGDNIIFNCIHSQLPDAHGATWLLNQTQLQDIEARDVEQIYHNSELIKVGTLTFHNISVEYNNTEIKCQVMLTSQTQNIESQNSAMIQIQHSKLITCFM